mmetsp:Transcript_1177/g.3407  ORF Transcript_1177/g.3407 Transcript_1177/m.3407 type:complete len:405 (-) Transcript_1177:234-1448(-)
MLGSEHERRTEADGLVATATNLDACITQLAQNAITSSSVNCIDGTEGALASRVGQVLREGLLQLREPIQQVLASDGRILQQLLLVNGLGDGLKLEQVHRVADPGVEDAVRLAGHHVRTAVVASDLHLLAECDNVWRVWQVPRFMCPEVSCHTTSRLHLIHHEGHSLGFADGLQPPEEVGRGMIVAALRLNRLHDHGSHGPALALLSLDGVLHLLKGRVLLGRVLGCVLRQWVLEAWEGHRGPVEGGDVQLVQRLGARCRHAAHEAAVEGAVEGEDGQRRRTGGSVLHAGSHILLRRRFVAALASHVADERGLERVLVGAGAAHHGHHVVQAFGRHLQQRATDALGPVQGGQVAVGGAMDEQWQVLGVLERSDHVRVVVAERQRRDVAEQIQQRVAVRIHDVVSH